MAALTGPLKRAMAELIRSLRSFSDCVIETASAAGDACDVDAEATHRQVEGTRAAASAAPAPTSGQQSSPQLGHQQVTENDARARSFPHAPADQPPQAWLVTGVEGALEHPVQVALLGLDEPLVEQTPVDLEALVLPVLAQPLLDGGRKRLGDDGCQAARISSDCPSSPKSFTRSARSMMRAMSHPVEAGTTHPYGRCVKETFTNRGA